MSEESDIDRTALIDRSYAFDRIVGFSKHVGDACIMVGAPLNQLCVYIRVQDLPGSIITDIDTLEQLDELEKLLSDCFVDHDYGCVEDDGDGDINEDEERC